MNKKLNIGIIGIGEYGRFLIETYKSLSQINIEAIADTNKKALTDSSKKYHIKNYYQNYQELLKNKDIDIVVVSTPPGSHYKISKESLLAGKHVLCEKPISLKLENAKSLIKIAKDMDLKISVDYEMRFNDIYQRISQIIKSNVLGKLSRVIFENYATCCHLPPKHWFWDKKISGGIFVEHGVHFFDIYNYLLGDPKFLYSLTKKRKNTNMEDEVFCALEYPSNTLATFYHAFNKASSELESTENKLIFEKGTLSISGWIPISLEGDIFLTNDQKKDLEKIITVKLNKKSPNVFDLQEESSYKSNLNYQFLYKLGRKENIYKKSVQETMIDFANSITNKNYKPVLNLEKSIGSLEIALKSKNYQK